MENQAIREAEKIIIAAILQSVVTPQETGLDGFEFSSADHANIFLAAKHLTQAGEPLDLITLANYLAVNNAPDGDGKTIPPNPQILSNIARSVSVPANLKPALDLLFSTRARKRLKDLSESIAAWSADQTEAPLAVIERAQAQLDTIRQTLGLKATNRKHISEIAPQMLDIYKQLKDGVSFNVPTGIGSIDQATAGGGAPGEVWLIGAYTGNGKSALALQMAKNQSDLGISSLIVSREMLDIENFKRLHSNISNVPLWTVRPGMSEDLYRRLAATVDEVARQNIYIDSVSSDIHTVCAELKDFAKSGGKTAYIDYLQLLEGIRGKMMSRTEEIAYCSKMLKKTAMDTGLWIVELAQYNRLANYAGQAENHSFDGSSQIEKDASVVLHLELEKLELKPGEMPPKWRRAKIRMGKARNAPQTTTELWFRGETFCFTEEDPYSIKNYYQNDQDHEI